MTWNDLQPEEKAFYRWFHGRQCGLCKRGRCPIVDAQPAANGLGVPQYLPETIYGAPRRAVGKSKDVFFLAINPGGIGALGETGFPVQGYGGQDNLVRYANDHLSWFVANDIRRYCDSVTKGSLVVNAIFHGHPLDENRVRPTNDDIASHHEELASLCITNIAHCKSRRWQFDAGQENAVWDACGGQTMNMMAHWRPLAVVAFGWAPIKWLGHVHDSALPAYRGWHLDDNGQQLVEMCRQGRHQLPIGQVAVLERGGDNLPFVISQRYGPHWNAEGVNAVVESLRGVVG